MPRTKNIKLREVGTLENVFDLRLEESLNKFSTRLSGGKLLTLETGCGHGTYTVELAKRFPGKIFCGIDKNGARIWQGAKTSLRENLDNAGFFWGQVDLLDKILKENSLEEIIIPFPDPHIRRRSEKKRLVYEQYLELYKKLLVPEGRIILKTDNDQLYDYSLETLPGQGAKIIYYTNDLYKSEEFPLHREIQTTYELHYLSEGRTVKFICFTFLK